MDAEKRSWTQRRIAVWSVGGAGLVGTLILILAFQTWEFRYWLIYFDMSRGVAEWILGPPVTDFPKQYRNTSEYEDRMQATNGHEDLAALNTPRSDWYFSDRRGLVKVTLRWSWPYENRVRFKWVRIYPWLKQKPTARAQRGKPAHG